MRLRARIDDLALTLEEHRALNLERPYTDPPLGGSDQRRATRALRAAQSAHFTDHDPFDRTERSNPYPNFDAEGPAHRARRQIQRKETA